MKKLTIFVLSLVLALSFTACGKDVKRTSGGIVDQTIDKNTVSLVNDAYKATGDAIKSASALGYTANYKKEVAIDDTTTASRLTRTYDFITGAAGKTFSYSEAARSDTVSTTMKMYDDLKYIYGYYADTEYIITRNDSSAAFINALPESLELVDGTAFAVKDTIVVDTDGGGHGFVLEYEPTDKNFKPDEVYGPLYAETELAPTAVGLRISGIIDASGKITSETVTYTFTYPIETEVAKDDVDPDNSGVSATEKVTKTVKVTLTAEYTFNYALDAVAVPDGITVVPETAEGEEKPQLPKELSITDFTKLMGN